MLPKICLNLLVFFGVLSQGIIGKLSEKYIDESSELLVRQKRVINREPGGNVKENIRNVPYVVSIKPFRVHQYCMGAILTPHIVITAANCLVLQSNTLEYYRVYSGTSRTLLSGNYATHNVTAIRSLPTNNSNRSTDGIALMAVNPPFIYSVNTRNINLYEERIEPGLHGIVSGWSCYAQGRIEMANSEFLQSITVPVITHQQCATLYRNHFPISESDICTFDSTGSKFCGVHDKGAPLVIKVGFANELLGVHIANSVINGHVMPDVFMNLQNPRCKSWIVETIRSLETVIRH